MVTSRKSKTEQPRRTAVWLLGDDDRPRDEFAIGETIALAATGLKAAVAHDVEVDIQGRRAFAIRLMSDSEGAIEPTVMWPQLGLDDPWSSARHTLDEGRERFGDAILQVRVAQADHAVARTKARVAADRTAPILVIADREGRPLNGLDGDGPDPFLLIATLPFDGDIRVMLVPRQHDWRLGDPLLPVTIPGRPRSDALASGRSGGPPDGRSTGHLAVIETYIERAGTVLVEVPELRALPPGAYDVIARPLRYGHEQNDVPFLTARDYVGSRRVTGLVIRESFWAAKPVLGGCVNRIPISGRNIQGAPYFRYSDTFEIGANIYAALDPGIVDPGNLGKMCAFYVVPNKTETQWNASTALNHLALLGGNANVIKIKLQAGCINANKALVWPNATQIGEYDIVADFGNNSPDAAAFVTDASYDTPLDIIDGYFLTGFRVVEDPGTLSEWANVGNWNYDATTQGSVTVQDEASHYSTPGGFSPINTTVPREAHVYFPADAAGVTNPSQISGGKPNYPLIVVVHGNGHDYTSYDFLLQHLARNGFIAASIHLVTGMRGLGRANVFFEHLPVLQAAFGARLQNHIGVMGHSRGGEAILKIARLNQQGALGHGIDCLIALAPTDQYGTEVLGGAWATPYFVLYGSRDGDIYGDIWTPGYTVLQTGFAQYDRANGAGRHFVFVHKASHNGFITTNYDAWPGDDAVCETPATQRTITLAYMNAFFRTHLLADNRWGGMFTGEWQPPSVWATGVKLYVQTRVPGQRIIDDFESAPAWSSSSIGGTETQAGLASNPAEGKLHDVSGSPGLDAKSPHDSKGQRLAWNSPGDRLEWSIPAGQRNVSGFAAVSLRIGQTVDSVSNLANQPQNLRLVLRDGAGNERAVRVAAFSEVPYPDVRVDNNFTKSALRTARIPLTSYTIVCAGQPKVDLTDVVALALLFSETPTGEVEIDEIEFTN
jgi:hypothetical protein